MNDNILINQGYMMDYNLHELDHTTWCTKIENVFSRYGYNYVWINPGVYNHSLFMFEFKQCVKDCYLQKWTKSFLNSKLSFFKNSKIETTSELYLSSIRDRKHISLIASFDAAVMDYLLRLGYVVKMYT